MALDKALIGVVGAASAVFVLFCVLAVIVGCFCLRRAKKRHQQRLVEKNLTERRDRESYHHGGSHYMADTINSSRYTQSHRGSLARSDIMPQKMTHYRPKILEDSMISRGYKRNSNAFMEHDPAARDNQTVSTILVSDPTVIPEEDNTHPNNNQSNSFIVQGYPLSSSANQHVIGGYHNSDSGYVVYGYPVDNFSATGPEHQSQQYQRGGQVINQSVGMGHDRKLVMANSDRHCVNPTTGSIVANTSSEPVTQLGQGAADGEAREKNHSTKPVGQIQITETAAVTRQNSTQQGPVEVSKIQRQRDVQEDIEMPLARSAVPGESTQAYHGQYSNTVETGVVSDSSPIGVSPSSFAKDSTRTGSNTRRIDGIPDTTSHPVSPKSPRQDNYKVIKREHSGHSKMPEW